MILDRWHFGQGGFLKLKGPNPKQCLSYPSTDDGWPTELQNILCFAQNSNICNSSCLHKYAFARTDKFLDVEDTNFKKLINEYVH